LTWNSVYLLDTGKSRITGSDISGYSKVNNGNEIELKIISESMNIAKGIGQDPSLSKTDANGFFEEAEVARNSVENRSFTISGVLDFNISSHKTAFANLIKAVRSPAVFALSSDFTMNDDNPVNSSYNDLDDGNFDTNLFVYVVVRSFNASRSSDNENIVDYTLELVYTQL